MEIGSCAVPFVGDWVVLVTVCCCGGDAVALRSITSLSFSVVGLLSAAAGDTALAFSSTGVILRFLRTCSVFTAPPVGEAVVVVESPSDFLKDRTSGDDLATAAAFFTGVFASSGVLVLLLFCCLAGFLRGIFWMENMGFIRSCSESD